MTSRRSCCVILWVREVLKRNVLLTTTEPESRTTYKQVLIRAQNLETFCVFFFSFLFVCLFVCLFYSVTRASEVNVTMISNVAEKIMCT